MDCCKVLVTKGVVLILILLIIASLSSCSSLNALNDIDANPENAVRGDPDNPIKAKQFLENVLSFPEGREVKAYNRRAYSPDNKKNLFLSHSFFVYSKNGEIEHTLVFTATPKGSLRDGNWMLDAQSDVDSYKLFLESDNPWELEEYKGPHDGSTLNLIATTEKILKRLDKEYVFFGPASVRDLPWYHLLWLSATPPPVFTLASILLMSIHADNCTSAVEETIVWN
jgi:hypothetical protein